MLFEVENITLKPRQTRSRWYGHIFYGWLKMQQTIMIEVRVRRSKGRPRMRWMDNIRQPIPLLPTGKPLGLRGETPSIIINIRHDMNACAVEEGYT